MLFRNILDMTEGPRFLFQQCRLTCWLFLRCSLYLTRCQMASFSNDVQTMRSLTANPRKFGMVYHLFGNNRHDSRFYPDRWISHPILVKSKQKINELEWGYVTTWSLPNIKPSKYLSFCRDEMHQHWDQFQVGCTKKEDENIQQLFEIKPK